MITAKNLQTFTAGEEIVTCPTCGARTQFLEAPGLNPTNRQLHWCLNDQCEAVFVVEEDK